MVLVGEREVRALSFFSSRPPSAGSSSTRCTLILTQTLCSFTSVEQNGLLVVRPSRRPSAPRAQLLTLFSQYYLPRFHATDKTKVTAFPEGFRMLVGREALRQGYLVDPSRSYAGGRPPKDVRRRNRGR